MFIKRSLKVFVIVIVAFAFASVGTAFAAANTVNPSKAGDGNGAVSGFILSAIKYNLTSGDPSTIDTVTFTLDSAPAVGSTIMINLVSGSSTWYTCSPSGTTVTCDNGSTLGATVLSVNDLRVVVSN